MNASPPREHPERPLVVVTGGTGLLGSALIERLVGEHRVVNLDLSGDPESHRDVEFICTDLTSDHSVQRAVDRIVAVHGEPIASVVHLAAYYDFAGRSSPLYRDVTVEGTRRLLDALEPVAVDQFVFSSTMLVHEPTEPGDPIDEDDPIGATWPYPESKVATEEVVAEEAPAGTRWVVVRLAGVYDEDGHSPPITNQIKRIDGGWLTSHFYPADPQRGQAFVHRDDAVEALLRIVARRRDLPPRAELLVAEPVTVGYGELQDVIAEELRGTDWTTIRIPRWLARIGAWLRERNPFGEEPFIRSWMVDRAADHYEIDIGEARRLLDWEPRHRVPDVIADMVSRLRKDRSGWYAQNDLRPPRRSAV